MVSRISNNRDLLGNGKIFNEITHTTYTYNNITDFCRNEN